ncbi:MAG: hypothetical protein QF437_22980, partial [Planctomycetota bacterium]|nr:hypothetical protein [Planctomycetota bacterium]
MKRCTCILAILLFAHSLSAEAPKATKPLQLKGADFDKTAKPGFVGEYFKWGGLRKLPKIPDNKQPFYVSVDLK